MDDQVRELVALGKDHFQRGDYALAAGHLEQVVARGGSFADVHHMLGVIYHQLGEFESAQRAFQKALDINPGYIEAARAHSKAPRDPNGDEPLDSYTRGKIANLHAAVADGYLSVRRPNDAASEYRRALSLCPTFVDLRLKLAGALRDAGDVDGSLAEFRIAVQHAPAYVPARVALGTALYADGKLDEAVAQWEEVLRMDPGHRTAGMYLKLARVQAAGRVR